MADADSLESLMSRGYRAIAMGAEPLNAVFSDFRTAADDDPGFTPLAASTMKELSAVSERCFVSKTRADFLRRALSQQD